MKNLTIFKQNLPTDPTVLDFDIFFENHNDPIKMRSLILQLEDELKQISDIQVQLETTHRFAKGLYIRELFIPKNTVLTGKIHREKCTNVCSLGDITIITEEGPPKRVGAGFTNCSRSGSKKVGFAHEDTIWVTVHATEETDLDKIEEQLFTEEYSDLETKHEGFEEKKTMEGFLCQQQL